MRTYNAANGHTMTIVTTHTNTEGREVPDYWNAMHSNSCPCYTSTDW